MQIKGKKEEQITCIDKLHILPFLFIWTNASQILAHSHIPLDSQKPVLHLRTVPSQKGTVMLMWDPVTLLWGE